MNTTLFTVPGSLLPAIYDSRFTIHDLLFGVLVTDWLTPRACNLTHRVSLIINRSTASRPKTMGRLEQFLQWFRNTRFGRKFLDILYETAILILYLGAIGLLHTISDRWVGPNALLLGKIPVGYIIDIGHILAISLFLLEIAKDALEVIKDMINLARKS